MRGFVVAIMVAGAAGHGVGSGTGTSGLGSGSGLIVGDANAPIDTDTCNLAKDVSGETCLLPNADDGCGKDDDEKGGGCINGYTLQKTGDENKVTTTTGNAKSAAGYKSGDSIAVYCGVACGFLGRKQQAAGTDCLCDATIDEIERSLPQQNVVFDDYTLPDGVGQFDPATEIPDGITSGRLYLYHCTPCPASDVMDHTRPKPTGALIGGIAGPFAAIAFLVLVGKEY